MSESKIYNNVTREENAPATLLEQLVESRLENKMERGFNRILREMQANNAEIKSEIDKLDRKIDKVETELSAKIDKVDSKIDKVETELSTKIDKVETELSAKIDKVDSKIDKVETELKSEIKRVDSKVSRANILSATALTLITLIIGAIISWVINNHLKMN